MSELKRAIAYFEDAVRESDEIIANCSPNLQMEMTEQKAHFVVAFAALRKQVATEPIYDPPTGVADALYCPNCKYDLMGGVDSYAEHDPPYCWECGQALLWESKESRMLRMMS